MKKYLIAGCAAILAVVAFCYGRVIYIDSQFTQTRETYQVMLENLENYRDVDKIIESISFENDFSTHYYPSGTGYIDDGTFTIYISDDVEDMKIAEISAMLHAYLKDFRKNIESAKEQSGYVKFVDRHFNPTGPSSFYRRGNELWERTFDIVFETTNYSFKFAGNQFYVVNKNSGDLAEYFSKFTGNTLVEFWAY